MEDRILIQSPAEITVDTFDITSDTDRQKLLRSWSLVLTARRILCQLSPENAPEKILVSACDHSRAIREIELYINENQPPVNSHVVPEKKGNTLTSLAVLALLGTFHNLTYFNTSGFGHDNIDWLFLGRADVNLILSGEWWRLATALTLHSSGLHLMSNLLIGGYFVVRLCQMTGSGPGWNIILWSGILGNLCNTLVQPDYHSAVGASTALFGAIGAAGMITAVQNRFSSHRYWILPLAASCTLLALLGSGAEDGRTDVGAHIFGFFSGMVLGYLAGRYIIVKGGVSTKCNLVLGIFATTVVLGAWVTALLH